MLKRHIKRATPSTSTARARARWGGIRLLEVIDFEELLSELITMARMLRPHLGSRVASAMLTYGVR